MYASLKCACICKIGDYFGGIVVYYALVYLSLLLTFYILTLV